MGRRTRAQCRRVLSRLTSCLLLVWVTGFAAPAWVFGQIVNDNVIGPPTAPPVATAARVDSPPILDGDVLNDPAWERAQPMTSFWQTIPFEGQPASERTEVRIVYTADTIYFGVIGYDSNPAGILVSEMRRDSPLDNTDSFRFLLDTYLDGQNGFVFGTNPAGLEYDGQLVNEGEGSDAPWSAADRVAAGVAGRQQIGSGGGFNINWDGSWEVRTKISEIGWSAEFAIPFRTLQYRAGRSETWGLNFQRNIRRRNETAYWAPLPRQYTLFRASLAGRLEGLDLSAQRNLNVTPYVFGLRPFGVSPATAVYRDWGADLKYQVTPSLRLDATYNTDLAQVELVDQVIDPLARIGFGRLSLFQPETRPFFLENAGLFAVGTPDPDAPGRPEAEVFYSRRIGLDLGNSVPIFGGAKLSGRVAGFSLGLLDIQTEEPFVSLSPTPADNFGVVRVRRDLPNRSNVGALFVNRQANGRGARAANTACRRVSPPDACGDYNRTFAVDGHLGIGRNGVLSGFVARAMGPPELDRVFDRAGEGRHSASLAWRYSSRSLWLMLGYAKVANGFNPEAGFTRRSGFHRATFTAFHTYRPRDFLKLLEIRPHIDHRDYWGCEQRSFRKCERWIEETRSTHLDSHWVWRDGTEALVGVNLARERLPVPFRIFPTVTVPPGIYDSTEAEVMVFTNQSAPVSAILRTTNGEYYGGRRTSVGPGVQVRVGAALQAEFRLSRNDIRLPGGSFVANVSEARVSYSFTPRMSAQSLVQYNDLTDLWSTTLRFAWLQQANTGLFIVYADMRGLTSVPSLGNGRSLALKFSRMFDVLD